MASKKLNPPITATQRQLLKLIGKRSAKTGATTIAELAEAREVENAGVRGMILLLTERGYCSYKSHGRGVAADVKLTALGVKACAVEESRKLKRAS